MDDYNDDDRGPPPSRESAGEVLKDVTPRGREVDTPHAAALDADARVPYSASHSLYGTRSVEWLERDDPAQRSGYGHPRPIAAQLLAGRGIDADDDPLHIDDSYSGDEYIDVDYYGELRRELARYGSLLRRAARQRDDMKAARSQSRRSSYALSHHPSLFRPHESVEALYQSTLAQAREAERRVAQSAARFFVDTDYMEDYEEGGPYAGALRNIRRIERVVEQAQRRVRARH